MTDNEEKKHFPAFLIVLGIPLFWVIVYSFARRKRSMCVQQFGPSECRQSPIARIILAFAVCAAFYGIVRIRVRRDAMQRRAH